MSPIRWLGLLVGLVVLVLVFRQFRLARLRRIDFLLGMLFAVALATVSIEPSSVNRLRDLLLLDQSQFSRLIAILIVSNILLWLLLLYTRFRSHERILQFDRLVRQLGVREFDHAYPNLPELSPILVVIPAYNEEESLGHVLAAISKSPVQPEVSVVVVDDGSEDGTLRVAREAGVLAVRNPIQRGGGAALRLGFDIGMQRGAQIIVTMDADGQHLPEEMGRLLKPILSDQADVVIGSRILGKREKDSAVRYLGIHVFNWVIRLLTPIRITDCSNGYRAFRVEALERLHLIQDQFHTSELIIEAARKGCRIQEVPVTVRRRLAGESKKGRNFSYGLWFARTVLKSWWR